MRFTFQCQYRVVHTLRTEQTAEIPPCCLLTELQLTLVIVLLLGSPSCCSKYPFSFQLSAVVSIRRVLPTQPCHETICILMTLKVPSSCSVSCRPGHCHVGISSRGEGERGVAAVSTGMSLVELHVSIRSLRCETSAVFSGSGSVYLREVQVAGNVRGHVRINRADYYYD